MPASNPREARQAGRRHAVCGSVLQQTRTCGLARTLRACGSAPRSTRPCTSSRTDGPHAGGTLPGRVRTHTPGNFFLRSGLVRFGPGMKPLRFGRRGWVWSLFSFFFFSSLSISLFFFRTVLVAFLHSTFFHFLTTKRSEMGHSTFICPVADSAALEKAVRDLLQIAPRL